MIPDDNSCVGNNMITPMHEPAMAKAALQQLDESARRIETPCGDGTMVWRVWGQGPALLLCHGGAGSWRHWARNIDVLSASHTVVVPDLPGLGDSASAPEPVSAHAIRDIVAAGFSRVVPADGPVDVSGFSFGGVIAGLMAEALGPRLHSLTLIGSGGIGLPNRQVELIRLRDKEGDARRAAHRENLLRLMLAFDASVDELALEIQEQNSRRARLNSGFMWISTVLADALPRVHGRVHGWWGKHDMPTQEILDARIGLLRQARPDADIRIFPQAGHWLSFEAADSFHQALVPLLAT